MLTDPNHAFDHPEHRAAATASGPLRDRISLRDHVVTVDIGAFQQERGSPQRIRFNLVVEVAPHDGAAGDDVDRILSYDTLTGAIARELADERLNLLETLAERIAQRILAQPQALRVFVRIEKLDRGPGALGVEIVRENGTHAPEPAPGETAHPLVVYLGNAALASERLRDWLTELSAVSEGVVLCVGRVDGAVPRADVAAAQRRIDLLAIEQNAWVLAGRDRRCVVVSTRTEIDWAIAQRQLTVWAPSKIVLDSVEQPGTAPGDGPALALWFAGRIAASALICVGEDPPNGGEIPVRAVAANAARLLQA